MSDIAFRLAAKDDIPAIVNLLADDEFGRQREVVSEDGKAQYATAFEEIEHDPNNEIIVGVYEGQVVAALQSTYIRTLTLKGLKRVTIEGVRVSSKLRGKGFGKLLFEFAFDRARARGCKLAQLTSNKSRTDALRFYQALGFSATHEGMKLNL